MQRFRFHHFKKISPQPFLMVYRNISDMELREVVQIIQGAALSVKSGEYEDHIMSNKKLVAIYKDLVIASSPNFEFFDCPARKNGCPAGTSNRCFDMGGFAFNTIPYELPIVVGVMDNIIGLGPEPGLPIGMILLENDGRKEQIMNLGRARDGSYGKVIDYIGSTYDGEIRLYECTNPLFNVPCSYVRRN